MHKDRFFIAHDARLGDQDVGELALSIKQKGLLQPVLVKPAGDRFEVVGGRRRFRALTELLGIEELEEGVHYKILPPDADSLVIQFEENIRRKDFTPLEAANLVTLIHKRQVEKHGKAIAGKGWSLEDTGKLLGMSKAQVSRFLAIADNADLVKECKSVDEALGKIKTYQARHVLKKLREAKAQKVVKAVTADGGFLKEAINNFKCMDAIEYVKTLDRIDHVIVDPPYGIGVDEILESDGSYDVYLNDTPENLLATLSEVIPLWKERMSCGFVIIWTSFALMGAVRELLTSNGFRVGSVPIIWNRSKGYGKVIEPNFNLAPVTECAVYGGIGDPVLHKQGVSNLVTVPPPRTNRIHPTQKPEALLAFLLDVFTRPGDSVLDCFAGSGSTLRACIMTKRRFFGCELRKDYYDAAVSYTYDFFKETM